MEKPLGAEAVLKIEVVDGKIILSAVYDGKGVDGSVSIAADSDYFIDKLAALIPGDTAVEQISLGALKLGIKSIKV